MTTQNKKQTLAKNVIVSAEKNEYEVTALEQALLDDFNFYSDNFTEDQRESVYNMLSAQATQLKQVEQEKQEVKIQLDREINGLIDIKASFIRLSHDIDLGQFFTNIHENGSVSCLYRLGFLSPEFKTELDTLLMNFNKKDFQPKTVTEFKKRKIKETGNTVTYQEGGLKPLTKSETALYEAYKAGITDYDKLAVKFGIAPQTVRNHIVNMKKKGYTF